MESVGLLKNKKKKKRLVVISKIKESLHDGGIT